MKTELKGTILLLFTGLFYSLFGVFSRLISGSFGLFSQNWTRGILVAVICLIIGLTNKSLKRIKKQDLKWLVTAGVLMAFINPLSFLACNNLQLGTALFLLYSAIVLSSYFFSFILLKEKININKFIAVILCLIGLILILNFSVENFKLKFALSAVLSGIMYGLFTVSTKKVSRNYSSSFINFIIYVVVVLVDLPIALLLKDKLSLAIISIGWLYNILFGFNVVVTFLLLVKGFKYIEAQKGSLILLSEIVFVLIWGFILYKEVPAFTGILGGILVVLAMALPLISFRKLLKKGIMS